MTRIVFAAALALAATLSAISAQAQAPRTFVSAAGTDNSTCSFAAPCRHFQAAVNATSAGGEVDALDPAGYGPIIISQGITIEGQGWSYIAPPAGGNGITINTVSGDVTIRGVSLNGVGITGTTFGVVFTAGGSLNVRDCVIRNFSQAGIAFQPSASTLSQLFVSNTLVSNNGDDAIFIDPVFDSGPANGMLNHVEMVNNLGNGLEVFTNTPTIKVTVNDSVSASSTSNGVNAESDGGTLVSIMVRNSTIANNTIEGLQAVGTGATIRVTRSTITGNSSGWGAATNGVVLSYADNNIDGNLSGNGEPPNALTYK